METLCLTYTDRVVPTLNYQTIRIDDSELRINTNRLTLEPITAAHAPEMHLMLRDPQLYEFLPGDPPALDEVTKLYEMWEARRSPDGDELWLNWAGRRRDTEGVVGHFQAGIAADGCASIAYTVGLSHQRHGFATEGMSAVCDFLARAFSVHAIRAWIDTRNVASIRLVTRLGLSQIQFIQNADEFKGGLSHEYLFERTIGKHLGRADER